MIVRYSDGFLKAVSWFMKVGGITLYPFIVLRERYKGTELGKIKLNHEKIHIEQQKELLVVFFYVIYILNFIFNILTMNKQPYRNIIFEKEAYKYEDDPYYLNKRKRYSWIKNKK